MANKHTYWTVNLPLGDGIHVLDDTPDGEVLFRDLGDGRALLCYLIRDEYPISPYEDADYLGQIGTSNRHDGQEIRKIFQDALGLDSEWRPLLDEDTLNVALRRAKVKKAYMHGVLNPRVASFYYEQAGDKLEEVLPNPLRIMLDVHEHGGRTYSVGYNPRFPDRQWDCAYGGAVWVPGKELLTMWEGKTLAEKRALSVPVAEECVRVHNAWMNGDTWLVVTQHNNIQTGKIVDGPEVIGGYYGHREAQEARVDTFAAACKTIDSRKEKA